MRAVDSAATAPLSGEAWALYRAGSLQSPKLPVSGRPPRRVESPPF
jgi:hypothetical protein